MAYAERCDRLPAIVGKQNVEDFVTFQAKRGGISWGMSVAALALVKVHRIFCSKMTFQQQLDARP